MNYKEAWERLKGILEGQIEDFQAGPLDGDPAEKNKGFVMALRGVVRLMVRIEEEYEEIEYEKD